MISNCVFLILKCVYGSSYGYFVYRANEQAEKEIMDLRTRTSEAIDIARKHGKQIG